MNPDGSYDVDLIDSGIGIPKEDVGTIFNRFKKANQLEDSAGYGLGLSIVKSIADYHKITISISSEIAKGTTISLSFPAELIRT
jgi:signal transduction histidine kinase